MLVKRLEDFDNSLIESIAATEEFDKIRIAHENHEQHSSPEKSGYGTRKAGPRYGESDDKVPCVASHPGTYRKKASGYPIFFLILTLRLQRIMAAGRRRKSG